MMRTPIGRFRRAPLVSAAFVLIAFAALTSRDRAAGQGAVPLSRPGQEDLTFWVNHNGLISLEAEGELGFGDIARILLRRRANGEWIRPLRDRFTFRVQDPAALTTPDTFRASLSGGALSWLAAPQERFVAAASRTFNIPILVTNREAAEATFDVNYTGPTMSSVARGVAIPPGATKPFVLRAVETKEGPAEGRIVVRTAAGDLSTTIHFDVRPLVNLRVRLLDERGMPVAARVYVTGSDGLAYAPRGSSARITAMSAEYFFHCEDRFELALPAGETVVEAMRGPEYRLASRRVTLAPGASAEVTLQLERWTHPAAQGWWSGDAHIHANYTSPHHQVIEPRDVRLQAFGEDLNYANMMVANSSGAFIHDREYFEARANRLSDAAHFIYWNEENRSSAYGHMCFLGLKKLVEPFYNGFRDTPHWEDYPANFPLAQQVFDQGGAVSYAHPGMAPNFESASIKELPADLALGHRTAMDVLSNNDELATTQMWYRLLNCGFRVAISAGTDAFTNVTDHYLAGGNRVYVQSGPRFDYAAWLDAFRRGRSFASNGPVVMLTVNGKQPGDEIRFDAPGELAIAGTVTSLVPLDTVDVVVNGKVVHSVPAAGKESITIAYRHRAAGSCWIALRALGPRHRLVLNDTQAWGHTSPVYVTVAGKPVRMADDIRFYREWMERLIARTRNSPRFATPERRAEVVTLFEKALAWYRDAERQQE
ncbi:MAG: CehA/McbA family metallohydrolase [Bryobacteraceae bacterium]